jgi:hypothetical protein
MDAQNAFRCGRCQLAHDDRDAAEKCCRCEEPGCNEPLRYWSRHRCEAHYEPHWRAEQARRREADAAEDRAAFERAAKVDWRAYDGPVYVPGAAHGSCGEGYFRSVTDYLEHLYDGDTVPAYCWATRPTPPLRLDADDILDGALDDYHEDAKDDLDVPALQKALDTWCDDNQPESFEVDHLRAVLLDGAEAMLLAQGTRTRVQTESGDVEF